MFTIWSFLLIQIIIQLWNNVLFLEGIINIEKRSKYLKTCIFFKFEIVSHELQILLKIWSSQGVYQNVELYMVYTVILLALIYVRVTSEKKKKKNLVSVMFFEPELRKWIGIQDWKKNLSFSLCQKKSKGMYKLLKAISKFGKATGYKDSIYLIIFLYIRNNQKWKKKKTFTIK